MDRPDIIARVFNMKFRSFCEDVFKTGILGRCIAHVHCIEFQKRGLPHAHVLINFQQVMCIYMYNSFSMHAHTVCTNPHAHDLINFQQVMCKYIIVSQCTHAYMYAPTKSWILYSV